MKKDRFGETIPILDVCTKTDPLYLQPLGRVLRENGYEIFSVHTLIDDVGFTMSFQVWKDPRHNQKQAAESRKVVMDDSPGFRQHMNHHQK